MNNAHPMHAAAEQVQGQGRGEDTVLVHMTPNEVHGLQALARAHGGSLTINPHTGLPEAGILKKLLPTLAGVGLSFIPGVGPLLAAGLVAAGSTAATGSLKKGLLAGLQAYGGASLAGALAPMAAGAGSTAVAGGAAFTPEMAAAMGPDALATGAGVGAAGAAGAGGLSADMLAAMGPGAAAPAAASAAPSLVAPAATNAAKTGLSGAYARFGEAAREGIPTGIASHIPPALTTGLATMGLTSALGSALTPSSKSPKKTEEKSNYAGPYITAPRGVHFPGADRAHNDTSEFLYFDPVNTGVVPMNADQRAQYGYAPSPSANVATDPKNKAFGRGAFYDDSYETGMAGGGMDIGDGSFIFNARATSEVGNGSSSAGQEALKQLGGRPIRGNGDGVSDSIHARVGGTQEARVARDEVQFPPEAVRRIGGGDHKRGTAKLYAMMNRAEQARRGAKRGQDTGLASLMGAARG